MNGPAISLRPINELLNESFFVASYQRGYRWTERQVEDLLNDIWEFQSRFGSEEKASFYCLQPIVVKKRDGGVWELVDGQQRLITILLILTCLEPLLEILGKSKFDISFETREQTSGAFLQNIDLAQRDANIDYHHICNAYDVITRWFAGRDGNHKLKLLQCLLNDDELGRNVKVIWYELPVMEDPVEAFTRLNVGKIPLTNAELIRALFLRSGNFISPNINQVQTKIAQEWDGIEKILQSDQVWYFLHNGSSPSSRIEYVFQLIADEEAPDMGSADDLYRTFHFYNARFSSGAVAEAEWLKVKQYFMTLEEWFEDRSLYHLIGFLIHEGDNILAIRQAGKSITKSAFQQGLKERIFKRLMTSTLPSDASRDGLNSAIGAVVEDLEYGQDSSRIRSFLLLFNIATLLQNHTSNLRFPFDTFKKDKWDIEHVRSVESGMPARVDDQRQWLQRVSEYLGDSGENESLLTRVQSLLGADKLDADRFNILYHDLLSHFREASDADVDNGIGNLTLLDARTNRSYKNAVFPVKRSRVLELDRTAMFVPLCTKNVFLKCYSQKVNSMLFWSEVDRKSYQQAIIQTLVGFFEGGARL
jgi:hypothetical protein